MNKNMIQYNSKKKECLYYQDRLKKYKYYTDKAGCELLKKLEKLTNKLLDYNFILIEKSEDNNKNKLIKNGENIYKNKIALSSKNKITWTDKEYGHLGLQRMYLKLKSIQRFTETYNLLQRAFFRNFFSKYEQDNQVAKENIKTTNKGDTKINDSTNKNVTFLSVGGGPGFELIAARYFFEKYFPKIKTELISLDIQKSWEEYTKRMDIDFIESNIKNGKIEDLKYFKNPYNDIYLIFSYILIYVCDDKTVLMIKSLLENENVKGIFISDRHKRNNIIQLFKKHNIRIIYLLPYIDGHKDDRQLLLLKKSRNNSTNITKFVYNNEKKVIFTNVPFIN